VKACHVFNMANDSYSIIEGIQEDQVWKEFRRAGFDDVDLIINSNDFAMAFPHWEKYDIRGIDPYNTNLGAIEAEHPMPSWVKIWWNRSMIDPPSIMRLYKMTSPYIIRQLHPPAPICLQFHKPFSKHIDIMHEAGWGRSVISSTSPQERLARLAYRRSSCVVMTNPDMYSFMSPLLFDARRKRKDVFIPFAINIKRYKPMKVESKSDDDVLKIFHPARMSFKVKGNNRLILAFAKFIKAGYKGILRMVDWGFSEDVEKMWEMINHYGIRRNVEFIQPCSKPRLIENYNWADVVADQFLIGSFGTLGPEAMSCAKPVLGFLSNWNIGGEMKGPDGRTHEVKCFGEMQPIQNASTEAQILSGLKELTDKNYRERLGARARLFVERYYSYIVVAKRYLYLYKKLLNGEQFLDD
jgi:glycosyltransferase involved in cell wall biosynthesis